VNPARARRSRLRPVRGTPLPRRSVRGQVGGCRSFSRSLGVALGGRLITALVRRRRHLVDTTVSAPRRPCAARTSSCRCQISRENRRAARNRVSRVLSAGSTLRRAPDDGVTCCPADIHPPARQPVYHTERPPLSNQLDTRSIASSLPKTPAPQSCRDKKG